MSDNTSRADQRNQSTGITTRRSRRKGKGKRLLLSALTIVVLLAAVVVLLPTLVSTGAGTSAALGLAQQFTGYQIEADSVGIAWTRGQQVRNVAVTAPNEAWSLTIDRLQAPNVSLFSLLIGGRDIGSVRAGKVKFAQNKVTKAEDAEKDTQPDDKPAKMPTFPEASKGLKIDVSTERFTYVPIEGDPVEARDFQFTADLSDLQALSVSMQGEFSRGEASGSLDFSGTLTDAFTPAGEPQFDQAQIQASANLDQLPMPAVDRLADLDGKLTALLGEQLSATLDVPKNPLNDLTATLTADSSTLDNVNLKLAREGDSLQATGSTATLTISPQTYAMLTGMRGDQAARLREPLKLTLQADQLTMPRPTAQRPFRKALEQAAMNVSLNASDVLLTLPQQGEVSLAGPSFSIQSDQLSRQATVSLAGQLTAAGESGAVDANLKVNAPLSDQPSATLAAKRLPVVIADALAQQQGRLVGTLGQTLAADLKAEPAVNAQNEKGWSLTGTLSSDRLNAPIKGAYYPGQSVAIKTEPDPLTLTLSPEAANGWLQYGSTSEQDNPSPFRFAEPIELSADVQRLSLAFNDQGGLDFGQSQAIATLQLKNVAILNDKTGFGDRENITIKINGRDPQTQLEMIINVIEGQAAGGADQAQNNAAGQSSDGDKPGRIQSTTTVEDFIDEDGNLAFDNATVESESTFTNVSSSLIDTLAGQNGQLALLLGPRTSGSASLTHKMKQGGNAVLNVNATHVNTTFDSRISADRTVELNRDATLTMQVTPGVSQGLLRQINPLLGAAVSAEAPLKLTIEKDSFALPLREFSLKKIKANARLHQARITLASRGLAGQALGLLNKIQLAKGKDQYGATLNETDLRLSDGDLQYDKLGIEVADVTLQSSGLMKLAQNRVDLSIELAGRRIPNELRGVEIPVTGPIDNPKIETKQFLAAAVKTDLVQRGLRELLGDKGDEKDSDGSNGGAGSLFKDLLNQKRDKKQDNDNNTNDNTNGPRTKNDQKRDDAPEKQKDNENPFRGLFENLGGKSDDKNKDSN